MSYYFAIIGTKDNPLFEYEFGTAKQSGDGVARFPEAARYMNQFIVHAAVDMVEEQQWNSGQMYDPPLLCFQIPILILAKGISKSLIAITTTSSPAG